MATKKLALLREATIADPAAGSSRIVEASLYPKISVGQQPWQTGIKAPRIRLVKNMGGAMRTPKPKTCVIDTRRSETLKTSTKSRCNTEEGAV